MYQYKEKVIKPMLKLLFITPCLLILLVSCQAGDSSQKMMTDYLYRLANTLEQGVPDLAPKAPLLAYPARRQLLIEIDPVKINFLEFLRLSECDVQRLVGERNSSLGKVSKDSQRFLYDLKFIRRAQECVELLITSNEQAELKETLVEAIAHKKRFLSSVWFNATFASDEFAKLFSLSSQALTTAEAQSPANQLDQALVNLTTAYSNRFTQPVKIENNFAIIDSSKYMGQLRHSMALISRTITSADALLDHRLYEQALCLNQRPNQQSEILEAVFVKFYIGQVQPYIAQVHQQSGRLLAHLDQLQQSVPPEASRVFSKFWYGFYRSENSEWQHFNEQVAGHTLRWQKLLAQCGLQPGQ